MQDDDRSVPYQEFVRLYTRCERDIRAFVRSLLPTWTDADDVLQQTALVLWKKFDQFDSSGNAGDFIRWACVIARFEALAYRRKIARDRLVFRDDLMELLAEEYVDELETRQHEQKALQHCLRQLPSRQRELLQAAYTPDVTVKELAAQCGASPAAFYMRLNRLRRSLLSCIRRRLHAEGLA